MTISPKNWPLKAGAFSLLAAAALAGVDQALKIWATAALQPVGSAQLLPGFIELRYVLNDGMAFSMLSGQRWLLLGGTGLILAALAVLLVVRRMPLPERQALLERLGADPAVETVTYKGLVSYRIR